MKTVAVIGAGLTGSLMAIYLKRAGYDVIVFERRADPRAQAIQEGRSINLAISARGLRPLQELELEPMILQQAVPVRGRMIHDLAGQQTFQAYGRNYQECNYALSRGQLNHDLITAAEQAGIPIYFQHRLINYKLSTQTLIFQEDLKDGAGEEKIFKPDFVIACDGANSVVRQVLEKQVLADFEITPLGHGYKELMIPAALGSTLVLEALHIWPREAFMLMALPNPDHSFTCTLFMAKEGGANSFSELTTEESVAAFFKNYFSDAVTLIPDLLTHYFANPTGQLGTVKGGPWFYGQQCLLLGDAAHAIVPFLGQGMNCAFEDCRLLAEMLAETKSLGECFEPFYINRRQDCDAIAELALANYLEMRDHVANPTFLLQKQIEQRLMQIYPEQYISQYAMISYQHTPYNVVKTYGLIQKNLLKNLTATLSGLENLTFAELEKFIQQYQLEVAKAGLNPKYDK